MTTRMMRLALAVSAALAATPVPAAEPRFVLGPREFVAVLGDSISCPNENPELAYLAYVETWLRTRQPDRRLAVMNVSWPGETAAGALARFRRDVAPIQPTAVWLDFGVNDGVRDGKRGPADPAMVGGFRAAMRGLVAATRALSARPLIISPSCVDYRDQGYVAMMEYDAGGQHVVEYAGEKGFRNNHELDAFPQYNGTIARFVDEEAALAREGLAPFIDLFHPMIAIQRMLKRWPTTPSLTADTIHPNPTGTLLMTREVLKGLGVAGPSMHAIVEGGSARVVGGGGIDGLAPLPDGVRFRLRFPCLPIAIPREGRLALNLIPFEREYNDFTLRLPDWPAGRPGNVFCDGRWLGEFPAADLRAGLDLAVLEGAPWNARSRGLQAAVIKAANAAREAWLAHVPGDRSKGLGERPQAVIEPAVFAAQRPMLESLSGAARPGTYGLTVRAANPIARGPRPCLLEGWEGENAALWYTVDGVGEVRVGREAPSEGARSLAVVARDPGEPRLTAATKVLPDLDLGRTRKLAVDWRARATGPGVLTISLSVQGPGKVRGTVAAEPGAAPGSWRTATFPLGALKWDDGTPTADRLGHVSGLAVTVEGTGDGRLLRLDFDNLRIVE